MLVVAFGGFQKHVSIIQQEVFMIFLQWGGGRHTEEAGDAASISRCGLHPAVLQ